MANGLLGRIAQGGNFDIAGSYLQGLSNRNMLQGQQLQNRLREQQLQAGNLEMQQAKMDQQRQQGLATLRPQAVMGDQKALSQVAAIDPEEAVRLQELSANLSEQQREAMTQRIEGLAREGAYILELPEEVRAQVYNKRRPILAEQYPGANLPEQYDEMAVRRFVLQARPMQEYFRGQRKKEPLVQVNTGEDVKTGTVPAGYALRRNESGDYEMYKIKGGPAEQEEIEQQKKEAGRREQTQRAGGTVIQDLQRALDIVEENRLAVGAPSILTQVIPESDAQAAKGMIESALSNIGLDTLQQMRENSPTGGALGQVPIQQQKRLEQVLGSLDLSQRPGIVQDNLKRVINIYKDIVHGTPDEIAQAVEEGKIEPERARDLSQRYELSFDELGRQVEDQPTGTPGAPATPMTQADFDALPSGAVYRDPDDGKLYRKQ